MSPPHSNEKSEHSEALLPAVPGTCQLFPSFRESNESARLVKVPAPPLIDTILNQLIPKIQMDEVGPAYSTPPLIVALSLSYNHPCDPRARRTLSLLCTHYLLL